MIILKNSIMDFFDFNNPVFLGIFIACITFFAIWEMIWKGFALWRAARNKHLAMFICIIIFNTVGILPIIYLLTNKAKKE
jgi:hypothetical protein